jgi:hypothetical protein
MAQKSEQKRAEKTKSLEYQYKPLSNADKRDVHIKMPILGWEINVDKRRAREGVVSKLNGKNIFNQALTCFIRESARLVIQAIEAINDALTSKTAPETALKALRALWQSRLLECSCCFELCNMTNQEDGLSPAINSAGETYCKNCMQQREEDKGPVSFTNGVLEPLGEKEGGKPLYSLTNIPLINAVDDYLRFIEKLTTAVVRCMPMVVRLAVKKNAHHHAGASDDKATILNNQAVDPMTIFLLEMGMCWRFFTPQNFYAVFEKLSPTTQWRCFVAPQTHGNDLLKMLQK